jgi:hypothetical protein
MISTLIEDYRQESPAQISPPFSNLGKIVVMISKHRSGNAEVHMVLSMHISARAAIFKTISI